MTGKKMDRIIDKVAECIFLNHKMQFHVTPQLKECFSAAQNRQMWTDDYKRLSAKDKKRWKVIARSALLQFFTSGYLKKGEISDMLGLRKEDR